MQEDFIIHAEVREDQGKGASRRLRRAGKVPAILYGGEGEPRSLQLSHNEMFHHLEHEAFFSHILTVEIGGKTESAVLKDVQRHPSRPIIMHIDLQRVVAGQEIKMHVPVHFIGEKVAPGVKAGGVVDHLVNELEIVCLPKDLPEYIEIDVSALEMGDSIHLSELTLPEGVTLTALQHGGDTAVVAVHQPRAAVEEDEDAEAPAADEVPTAGDEEKSEGGEDDEG